MRFLGIDPGTTGAACIYSPDAPATLGRWHILDIPTRGEKSRVRLQAGEFRDWVMKFAPDRAVIELVNPMQGQGVSSTATFIGIARAIEAVVEACDIPVRLVTPQVWKNGLMVPEVPKTEGQTRAMRTRLLKQASRGYALRRFPELAPMIGRVMDSDRAEAALMAYYACSSLSPELTEARVNRVDRAAPRA